MMRKIFTLALSLLLLIVPRVVQSQEELTVYEGTTTNNYVPAYVYYFDGFTKSQFVIPAADLEEMTNSTITGIKFYTNSDNIPYTSVSDVVVYFMEVDYTSINAYEPRVNGTLVYQGVLGFVSEGDGGSLTIEFSTPYTYTGGNLLVGIENITNNGWKNMKFFGMTVNGASIAGNSSSLDGVPATQRNFIPKTTFTYIPAGGIICEKPTTFVVNDVTAHTAVLTWTGSSCIYNVEYKKVGSADWSVYANGISDTTLTMVNLMHATDYQVRVQSVCADGVSGWKSVLFSTNLVNYDRVYVTENGTGDGGSWATATSDLNWALTTASMIKNVYGAAPDVWVAAGIYYGDTTAENAFTMVDGVNVYGGFAGSEPADYNLSLRDFEVNETILDGQNARRVLYQSSSFNVLTTWDGFTVRNGHTTGSVNGGGAYLNSRGQLSHCVITNNTAYNGGGVCAYYASLSNCVITHNNARNNGGGVCACYASTNVANCLISNNTANSYGGGVYNDQAIITNSTVVRNTSNYGSGIYGPSSGGILINSIVWGNGEDEPDNILGDISCSYSAIEGVCAGESNIVLNDVIHQTPQFVKPSLMSGTSDTTTTVDWHLQDGSVCINHGNNEAVMDSVDLDGTVRVKRDTVDLGCYESDYYSIPIVIPIVYVTENGAGTQTGDSWENAMASIQDAMVLAHTQSGMVWVAAGTYYGNATSSSAFTMINGVNVYGGFAGNEPADYDLSLRNFEANVTILDGQNARRVVEQPSSFNILTTWDGFTIQNGYVTGYNGGGACLRSKGKISHCVIKHNLAYNGGGVYAVLATISNCLISNNTASKYGGGVYASSSIITNSTIVRNMGSDGSGIWSSSSGGSLTNSIVWGNGADESINLSGSITCSYSAVEGGFTGNYNILLSDSLQQTPLFVHPSLTSGVSDTTSDVNWHLQQGSVCINHGNNMSVTDSADLDGTSRIKRDTVDLGCYESDYYSVRPKIPIVYVTENGAGAKTGDSWANAMSSIQDAMALAQTRFGIVWVAAGIYYGETDSTSENAFTMVEGVDVYGGFAGNEPVDYDLSLRNFDVNATILDGQDTRRVLYQSANFSVETIWDGFTIQNGFVDGDGSGAYLQGNAMLRNSIVQNNRTSYSYYKRGGGVYANGASQSSKVKIIHCIVRNNYSSYPGGGAYLRNAIIEQSVIMYNRSLGSGGGLYAYNNVLINNCLVANNTSDDYYGSNGGGVFAYSDNISILNTTIVRNLSTSSGAGIYSSSNSTTLTNSIVWGNMKNEMLNNVGGSLSCSYSAIEGYCNGDNVIVLSEANPPLFVNPSSIAGISDTTNNVDWHLQEGSLCINRGDNNAVMSGLDLDDMLRIRQDTVDLGCYESNCFSTPYSEIEYSNVVYVTPSGAGRKTGENWANACSSISSAVSTSIIYGISQVWVAAGIYYGDTTAENAFTMVDGVNVYGGFAGNEPADYELSLRDFKTNETILDGQNARRVLNQPRAFNIETEWDGFTIQNGHANGYGGGAYLKAKGMLTRCVIKNNMAHCGGGIYAYGTNSVNKSIISHCQIMNNLSDETYYGNGGGVYISYSTIRNCLVANNTCNRYGKGGGVYSSYGEILNTTIVHNSGSSSYNEASSGLYSLGNTTMTNSIIWGNSIDVQSNGLSCSYSAIENGYAGDGNITLNIANPPLFIRPSFTTGVYDTTSNVDWRLREGSPCINKGDNSVVVDSLDLEGTLRVKRDTVDLGCFESDYYHSDGVGIQNVIYVTQTGSGNRSGNSWDNAMSSIEKAQISAMNIGAVVWVAAGTYYGDTSSANAFTMHDGVCVYGGFGGNEPADYDLALRNFEINTTILDGADERRVLYQPSSFNATTIWDGFTVQNGHAIGSGTRGGGAYLSNNGKLCYCVVRNNIAYYGGGIYLGNNSTLSNCILSKNSANEGGGVYAGSNSNVSNCLISNNTGGGVYDDMATITNSTIVRNLRYSGAGIYCPSEGNVVNSIVWGNGSNETDNIYGNVSCSYSAVEGGYEGNNNILLNSNNPPLFVNPSAIAGAEDSTSNVDWHLQLGSPCINRGDNTAVTDSLDVDAIVRVKRDTVDLGCYESDFYNDTESNNYGSVVYVTPTGAGNYSGDSWANATSSIEEAQAIALTHGAVVWVAAGIYYGDTIGFNAFTMREGVNVYGGFAGDEPDTFDLSQRDLENNASILDGMNTHRVLYQPNYFNNLTTWDGFTIQNGKTYEEGSGCYLQKNGAVSRCKITHNQGGGVYSYGSIINNCLISNNSGGGVCFKGNTQIINSTVVRNYGGGLTTALYTSGDNFVKNCIVWGNEPYNIYHDEDNIICTYSAVESGFPGDHNIPLIEIVPASQPFFMNPSHNVGVYDSTENVDWHLQHVSPCINRGDNSAVIDSLDMDGMARIKRDTVDMGCYESDYYNGIEEDATANYDAGIIYVTQTGAGNHSGNSWENATSSIDTAQILAQAYSSVVWVAAGTYYGDTTATSENAFTMIERVNVYGGFAGNEPVDYDLSQRNFEANATILDGQNARRVLYQPSSFAILTIWDGFTIQNGVANADDGNYWSDKKNGGGVYLRNKGKLDYCVVKNNRAYRYGGGVYATSQSVVRNCHVSNNIANSAGGGIYANTGEILMCLINGNSTGYGGAGVYVEHSVVSDCQIVDNEQSGSANPGGGVYAAGQSIIRNCLISNNVGYRGGGAYCSGSIITQCLISHNSGRFGNCGGVDLLNSTLKNTLVANNNGDGAYCRSSDIVNSTIVKNIGLGVNSLDASDDSTVITNSIIWGNETSDGTPKNLRGSVICSYSAIEGGYEGESVVALNAANLPFFFNPSLVAGVSDTTANVDWHLQQGSPCINHGLNSAVTDSLDLDGTARIKRDTVDLGCYESDYYCVPPTEYDSIIYVTVTGAGTHSGDSWGNAMSSIDSAQALAQTHNAVVWVAAGTYYGDTLSNNAFTMYDGVNVYGGFAGNEPADYDVSLRDFETNATILDGMNARRVLYQPISFNRPTTWDGFTIQNGQAANNSNGGGAYLGGKGKLYNCTIKYNSAYSGGGVYAENAILSNCEIRNNNARYGGGVYAYRENAIVSNCLISNNTAVHSGGGVSNNYGTITSSTIVRNIANSGAGVYGSNGGSLTNSIVWGNGGEMGNNVSGSVICAHSAVEGGVTGDQNILLSDRLQQIPLFVHPSSTSGASDSTANVDWHLQQGSPCINRGDNSAVMDSLDLDGTVRIKRDTVDLGCYESDYYGVQHFEEDYDSIIYVTVNGAGNRSGNSWNNALTSIDVAQSLALMHNAVVWISAGIYYGDTNSNNAFVMRDGVNVYGGFAGNEPADYDLSLRNFEANATILDGMNARRVLYQPSEFNAETVWDGFTIQNGKTTYSIGSGAGVFLRKNGRLLHSIVQNCYSGDNGGGLYCGSYSSVSYCKMVNNIANRVGAYSCGGGIYCGENVRIINCEISNNTAYYGGGVYCRSYSSSANHATLSGCLILNNTSNSYQGSGVYSFYGNIYNSTIINDQIHGYNETTVKNCIVWGSLSGSVNPTHSAIPLGYGNYSGEGNIMIGTPAGTCLTCLDPMFVNPSLNGGDWHLKIGSPCINAGDNSTVIDSLDLDGNPRVNQGQVDMGCYEYDPNNVPVTNHDSIIYVTVTGAGTHSGDSWANAVSSLDTAQTLAQEHNAVVWVAAGTYYGDTTATSAFTMYDSVNVYGGFAGDEPADYDLSLRDFETNATILDGMNARRVLYQQTSFNTQTTWNGFTIQNGQTTGNGGGAYLLNKGALDQCVISQNTAGYGGGVYAQNATISNCTIRNNASTGSGTFVGGYGGGGLHLSYSTVTNSMIVGNSSHFYGGGIYATYSSILYCKVVGNQSSASGGGMYLATNVQVRNCLVSNNTSGSQNGGSGIYANGINTTVVNTTIVRNSGSTGVAGLLSLRNSIVWGNERNGEPDNVRSGVSCNHTAVEGGCQGNGIIALVETIPPRFVNPSHTAGIDDTTANVDWHLQQGSPCINRGDNSVVSDSLDFDGTARIKRDTVDLGCYESDYYSVPIAEYDSIIYVTVAGAGTHSGDSWANAISSIEDAQGLAFTHGAVVWVAVGTYYGDTTAANAFKMRDGVNVYGGFAGNEPADYDLSLRDFETNATILDGKNLRRVLYQPSNFNDTTEWDGFTIQHGQTSENGAGVYLQRRGQLSHCKVQNNTSTNGNGGGIYCSNTSLSDCELIGNSCYSSGGGIYASSSTVSDCRIEGNSTTYHYANDGGGGVYASSSTVTGCQITGNTSAYYGGGVYLSSSSTLRECMTTDNMSNFAGGVNATNSNVVFCKISHNQSSNSGGGMTISSGAQVRNCLVYNNTAGTYSSNNYGGGGISGNGTVVNTTIVRNTSTGDGAGVNGNSSTTLRNCIVWGNRRDGTINNIQGGSNVCTCSYSAIEGGYGGTNNIMLDETNQPHFVNPSLTAGVTDSTENVDWHLLQISVCINKGDNSVVTDSLDLDGTMRVKQDTVDLGCYESEYNSFPMTEYDSIIYVTETGSGTHTGNSWANAISSIASAQALAKTYNAKVWVASGTYYGNVTATSENAFTMVEGVDVYGGFAGNEPADYDLSLRDFEANVTNLDGQYLRRVLYQPYGFGVRTVWDGFTIRNGRTVGDGGGAYLLGNGVLNQCNVTSCMAAGAGGGVYSSTGAVFECMVTDCTAGSGGGVSCTNNTTVMHSTLSGNHATGAGGGLFSYNSTMADCDIVGNEADGAGGGVYCHYTTGWINFNVLPTNMIRCRITGNYSANRGGGVCMGYGNDQLSSCLVSNNASNMLGGGVYGNGHLYNTTVVRNTSIDDGAGVNGGGSTTLQNCIVWGNKRNGVTNNLNGSSIVCSYSAVEGGYPGTEMIMLGNGDNSPLFIHPSLIAGTNDSTSNVDWHLLQGSPCINRGDSAAVIDSVDLDGIARIKRDTVDLGCYESDYYSTPITGFGNIIYVTQTGAGNQSGDSWANATASIEEAQVLAQTYNAVVWVAAGTYYGDTTTLNAFTMHDGVNVCGGFAGNEPADFDLSQRNFETNATILDGQNERRVLDQPFEFNEETTWNGFTIQNGRISGDGAGANLQRNGRLSRCKVQNNTSTNGNGGGICCSYSSVESCDIVNNSCRKSGGGAYAYSSTVSDCRIENNTATNGGGGIYVDASAVDNCQIVGNQSSGDGGGAWSYDTRFTHCDIIGNSTNHSGGGVYSHFGTFIFLMVAPTTVSQCRISNNYAGISSGGIRTGYYNDKVLNSLVCNNTAGSFGGAMTGFGKAVNTTIVRNLSGGYSAGVEGSVNLKNCIVWGNKNSAGAANNIVGKEIVCSYSAVEGGFIGEGNFILAEENSGADNSPYFVNPTIGTGEAYGNGDWHLLPQSVCLNMGSLDTTILSDIDLDGQPRLQQNRVDMGCYEYQAATEGTVNVSVVSGDIMRGGAVGSGYYNPGDTVRLLAIPNLYARFLRWGDNDTTNPRMVIASADTTFTAFFEVDLPELHVTSISHSELIRGDSATVSWTVQNDGTVPTPDGAVWYDRVWLSPEPKVDAEIESGSLILLGTSPNVSALDPGQSYTQTMEVNIPLQIFGNYYLFVITDAYDADQIFWENGVEIPYNPPTYYGALSHNCYGLNCLNDAGNLILEISEYDNNPLYPYYHDNFFFDSSEVHLPQFPDLKVTSVFPVTQNFFSGLPVNLTYQVTNDGDYATWVSDWRDMIFVSNSPEFDSDAELLQIVPHHGLLHPDSSYIVSTEVTVPLDVYGTAYFYVHTDYYDQVYEHINNYNNISRSDSVNIFLTLPADLAPWNIIADNEVSTGATFNCSYEIRNQGAGAPNHDSWEDKCYLSTNADTLENAVLIATDQHFSGLASGESYAVQHSISLPDSLTTGTYYLFVKADAENNVFEYTSEENNLARCVHSISVVQPDLQIVSLVVDDTLHAGAEVAYSYRLANVGAGAVINQNMKDGLYLSPFSDGTGAVQIDWWSHNLWLNAQDSILKMRNVQLPPELQEGVYFLFIETNFEHSVHESDYNNNRSIFKQVYIHYMPLPDLVVSDIELPDTVTAGDSVTMRIHLHNQGEIPANVGNLDWRLFATKGGHQYDCVVEPSGADTIVLPPGGSVYLQKNVVISPIVFGNPVSFTLVVNPNHALTESVYSNNSHAFSHLVQRYPFDLAADQLSNLSETISGEYIPVTWTVENVGTMPMELQPMYLRQDTTYVHSLGTLQIPWYDRVYLSTDSLFDAGDVQIGSYTRNQTLNAGDSYTANLSCRIPVAADGDYHVLVVSDATNVTFDYHRANNVSGQPISVTQSLLPDLQMDTLSTISTLTTGDSYRVSYAVSNIGEHVTHDDRWTDAVYLNNQPTLVDAVLIGSKTHYGQLDVSESYSDSLSVTIPNTWIGNCYLIGVTDATGQIVELNDETNNMFALPVSIARPLPCDLTVIPPDIPQSAMVGEDIQISWTLRNIGLNTAQGNIKDAVYLSIDSTWSSDDIMLGSETFAVNLAADGQQQRNATLFLQGVPIGDYYVVVRTNILNVLNENSYDNNNAVSLLKIHVDYPSLYIDQEEHSQLNSGQSIYYKLEVGPEHEHQTLSVKLTAPSPYVSNDLYITYSSAPSASNSDWSATVPYVQTQEILIPSLDQGIYYIMVHGQTADEASQSVTLLASIIDFEIISVHVNSGANAGSVTTQIVGAKFDTIMDFRLANGNAYLPAEKIFFHNSTEAYATFNLRDQEPGVYDMEAELPGGIITVKGQAFVVEPGLPAELQAHIIAPAGVPNGTKLTITIEYGNNGSTDLDVSGFMLVSTNGFPIALCSDSLDNHSTVLTFETAEPDGNPDVIRPGHFATKTIFVWANHLGNIELKLYPIRRQY